MPDNEARPSKDHPRTLEQGQADWSLAPTAAKARLVSQDPTNGRGAY